MILAMEWEAEAARALERAPRFVRGLARRRVEEMVAAAGRGRVTLVDVQAAREKMQPAKGRISGPAAGLDEEQIRELEKRVGGLENLPALQTRYYSLRLCGAAAGCPRARVEISPLAERLRGILDCSGLDRHLLERIRGPLLSHHKFRLALSGCPNACSQPQIVDFGVIGRARPERGSADCTRCMACVQVCSEQAVEVVNGEPRIARRKCINCGDCVDVCPTEALIVGARGYSLLVGGRLGRHPRFAETLFEFVGEEEVLAALRACLHFYFSEALGAEKFSALVERKGIESFRRSR